MATGGENVRQLALEVLKILNKAEKSRNRLTAIEIQAQLLESIDSYTEFLWLYRGYWSRRDGRRLRLDEQIHDALLGLAELGLARLAMDDSDSHNGLEVWALGKSWTPPPSWSDDGNGGRLDPPVPPGLPGGPGDGAAGGGGIREALGHPVLFALHKDDFETLVSNLFEDR